MEIAALALQQMTAQNAAALSMIKQNAKSDQSLVNILAQSVQSAPSGGRGQSVDITI